MDQYAEERLTYLRLFFFLPLPLDEVEVDADDVDADEAVVDAEGVEIMIEADVDGLGVMCASVSKSA